MFLAVQELERRLEIMASSSFSGYLDEYYDEIDEVSRRVYDLLLIIKLSESSIRCV